MSIYTKKLSIQTAYMGMHDVTENICDEVKKSRVESGICHVSMLHSTAGLVVCFNSPEAAADIMQDIERSVPTRVDFKHRETASDAGGHIKTAIAGSQISLIIEKSQLVLGSEQAIVFAEFDGPRPRNLIVTIYAD